MLDGKPFKIISGAIHYFRIHPSDWEHSLYNLKALGFNTVETIVPWNIHEPNQGKFDFAGGHDLVAFLRCAQSLGLYAIVRPSPYICGEWEFGGTPAWLLKSPTIRIRSSDPEYLHRVDAYYSELIPRLIPLQLSNGGNILMFQIENEYGSYGDDKDYLRALRDMMQRHGLTQPFFTSDGPWQAALRTGSLVDDGILATGNFGSHSIENMTALSDFLTAHERQWPLMCMEFWTGWFNRWGEPIVRRDTADFAQEIQTLLTLGSINLYMFHGGTNFGFMNGCSARGVTDLPQITSYDYDAPLNEQGNPTEKYFALQAVLRAYDPEIEQTAPRVKPVMELLNIPLMNKVSLFSTLDDLSTSLTTKYPKTMEDIGQNTGYTLYTAELPQDSPTQRLRVIDARDRVQVFVNHQLIATQYQNEIGRDIAADLPQTTNRLDLLIENMGRVQYGHKFLADTQKKGLRTGVMADLHFISGWCQRALPLNNVDAVDFSKTWLPHQPAFYKFGFELEAAQDTFADLTGFGKGCLFVNGFNVGRFWSTGPLLSLYIAHGLLKKGYNEIIVFESEGQYQKQLSLRKTPRYKQI